MTTQAFPWLSHYPKNIDWHAPMPEYPLWKILDDAVRRFPRRPCIDFLGRVYSYEEVGRLVDHAARGLQEQGVGKGTPVGLMLPNTPYSVIFYFAILKAGGMVVNINPLYADRELEHHLKDSGCEIVVALDLHIIYDKIERMFGCSPLKKIIVCRLAEALSPVKGALFSLLKGKEAAHPRADDAHIPYARVIGNDGQYTPVAINPREDVAVLQYTGGTTGTPKAAMLTHANLVANTIQSRLWFTLAKEGEEVLFGALPFFHVFAMTVAMNLSIYIGATTVMLPRFELKQAIETIHRTRPTLFPAVPTLYAAISTFRQLARYDISSVKYCISGGAGLPMDIKRAFEAVTGCVVVEGYGLTETSPVATCNPLEGVNKEGSIGLPLPQTVVEIISLEDGVTPVPLGERGEVTITGPQVMKGYWKNEAETKLQLRPGPHGLRLHTGDVGVMDTDGYICIVDRIKDMILCGGFNVYPRMVEEAIYLHPNVAECIVAGLPDPYRGQTVKAYVKIHDGKTLSREELMAFLKDKLSPIEMPKLVEFRDSLPKTMIGKLSRKALLEEEAQKKNPA
jgi:long-chain acyl-CoA synthetase